MKIIVVSGRKLIAGTTTVRTQ